MAAPDTKSSIEGAPVAISALAGLTEAIERWPVDPSPNWASGVESALAHAVASSGTAGARLELRAAPLPDTDITAGDRATGGEWCSFEIRSGGRVIGRLSLPVGDTGAAAEELARGLEMAVGSAWSRIVAGRAEAELAALDAATRGIAGVLDLDRVLQTITDRARELAHAQYAALGILDADGGTEQFITSGLTRAERERIGPPPRGLGLLGVIARESRPVRVHDMSTDPRRHGTPPGHPPMTSLLGVPLVVKSRSVGRLYLTNKLPSGDFTDDDERIVEMFALHAGIAIDNARLHEQVQRLAIVEERERIGRDLHDGIIQSIYAVGLSLEDVPDLMEDEPEVAKARVERAIDSLDQSIRDIRNFIFGLRPELLEQAGLVGGIAALADEFRVNSMVDIELDTNGVVDQSLPTDVVGQMLSIAREALSNIARHSKATRGHLEVEMGDGRLRMVVSDNGAGFDPNRPRSAGHQGLTNMRARAASIGGTLDVESAAGRGTRIIVEVSRSDLPRGSAADRGDQ
jgi:signal transduction histidine kinase